MVAGSSSQYGGITPLLGLGTVTDIIENLPEVVDTVDERVSTQLKSLMPDFVTSDHPTFSAFIQAYLEWMEQEGNPRYATVKHLSNRDIDTTASSFIAHFNSEYLHGFPASFSTVVNEKAAIKNIGDLYRSKGGEKAILLLFRLLYNETVTIIRPGEKIFGLSSGLWDDPSIIFVSRTHGISLAQDAVGKTIFQTSDGLDTGDVSSSAFITDGRLFTFKFMDVAEYKLNSVQGTFVPNKPVFYTSGATSYKETPFPMVGNIGVTSGGTGYSIHDKIIVKDTVNKQNVAEAIVTNIDVKGAITSVKVSKRYPNYIEGNTLDFDFITGATSDVTPGGTGATLEVEGTVAGFKAGRYSSSKDLLGAADKVQDNNYYQRYSYSVRTSRGIEEYRESLKKIAHPTGYRVFADTILGASGDGFTSAVGPTQAANKLRFGDTLKRDVIRYGHTQAFESPMIGHYLPYTFEEFTDYRGYVTGPTSGADPTGVFVDLFPFGYNGVTGDLAGNFVVGGRTAHIPQASTAAGGATAKLPLGVSDGTPDGITVGYGITESGHQLLDQIVWYNTIGVGLPGASATTGDSLALAVYPHPAGRCANSFGKDRYGADGKDMWTVYQPYTQFAEGLTMDFQEKEKIRQPICRVFIDSITGDTDLLDGDLVFQLVPGQPEAIGRLTFDELVVAPISTSALQTAAGGKVFPEFSTGFTKGSPRSPNKVATSGLGFVGSYENAFIDIQMISGRFSSVTGAGETAPYPIVSVTGGGTLSVIAKSYSASGSHINMIEGMSLAAQPEWRFLPIWDFLNNMPFADTSVNKSNYTSD